MIWYKISLDTLWATAPEHLQGVEWTPRWVLEDSGYKYLDLYSAGGRFRTPCMYRVKCPKDTAFWKVFQNAHENKGWGLPLMGQVRVFHSAEAFERQTKLMVLAKLELSDAPQGEVARLRNYLDPEDFDFEFFWHHAAPLRIYLMHPSDKDRVLARCCARAVTHAINTGGWDNAVGRWIEQFSLADGNVLASNWTVEGKHQSAKAVVASAIQTFCAADGDTAVLAEHCFEQARSLFHTKGALRLEQMREDLDVLFYLFARSPADPESVLGLDCAKREPFVAYDLWRMLNRGRTTIIDPWYKEQQALTRAL